MNTDFPLQDNTPEEDEVVPVDSTDPAAVGNSPNPDNHPAGSPKVGDGETGFQSIDPRQITVSRISGGIFSLIVFAALVVGLGIFFFVGELGLVWYIAAGVALAIVAWLFWMTIFWPVLEFRRTFWRLTDVGLEIRRGVLWRHQISVPYARVQHADVSQGPLQRKFELGKLTVHTAGTQNASVALEGIAHGQAVKLRDEIVRQREAVDVV